MRTQIGIGSLAAALLALAACATSSSTDETTDGSESQTESPARAASPVETVSEQSSRNQRELRRVADTVDPHVDKLESCYIRGALVTDKPDLAGELTFGWTIDDHGRAHGLQVLDDRLGHREIATCVRAILEGLDYERPESDSVEVQYPFEFDRASSIPHEDWYCRVHRSLEQHWSPPESLDDERLQKLARKTIVYARVNGSGAIRHVEFLERPDHATFVESLESLLDAYRPEGDHRLPMPRGDKLREYVSSRGLVLQNWRDPRPTTGRDEGDREAETKAARSTTHDEQSDLIFDDCGDAPAPP